MTVELLREQVLEKGNRTKDLRTILDIMESMEDIEDKLHNSSFTMFSQIERDITAQYKFYDALCMWLGQVAYLELTDTQILIDIANTYLKEA